MGMANPATYWKGNGQTVRQGFHSFFHPMNESVDVEESQRVRVLGPKTHTPSGFSTLKPYYLGIWALREYDGLTRCPRQARPGFGEILLELQGTHIFPNFLCSCTSPARPLTMVAWCICVHYISTCRLCQS